MKMKKKKKKKKGMRTCHLVIQKNLYVQIKKNSGATPKTTTLPTTHHMGELWTKLWFWVWHQNYYRIKPKKGKFTTIKGRTTLQQSQLSDDSLFQ